MSKPANNAIMKRNNKLANITQEAKLELIDKMVAKLPTYLKKRKKEFLKQLEEFGIARVENELVEVKDNRLEIVELTEYCFEPIIKYYGSSPTYSPEQLDMIFDYYRQITLEISKQYMYIPNKEDFCRLLGISTQKFSDYKNANNLEFREIANRVEDWISSHITQNAFQEKTDKVYSIFYQKAGLGRRDNDPIQINNYTQNNTILPDAEFKELLSRYAGDLNKK